MPAMRCPYQTERSTTVLRVVKVQYSLFMAMHILSHKIQRWPVLRCPCRIAPLPHGCWKRFLLNCRRYQSRSSIA